MESVQHQCNRRARGLRGRRVSSHRLKKKNVFSTCFSNYTIAFRQKQKHPVPGGEGGAPTGKFKRDGDTRPIFYSCFTGV